MNFGHKYQEILDTVMSRGVIEVNRRTGTRIKMFPDGISFSVSLRGRILPTCGLRKTNPVASAAEAAWCLLGHDHTDWLRKHTKVWDAFCDVKEESYSLPAAYGARWRKPFDQIATAIDRLYEDNTDRRIWISTYDPTEDLATGGQKSVPCPVGFTLSIMDSTLCSTLMIRSSDLYFGLPYDVMRHAFIMDAFAADLAITPGVMQVALAHPHVYEPQWKIVAQMLSFDPVCPPVIMPGWYMDQIVEDPDKYLQYVETAMTRFPSYRWPAFSPKSEVVK